ncbi:hypothetical protein [Fluviicola sp.]|uniref:hypothetical protein n=1 Tax=Fluviicola sp. TaxID=1917219 RepID=UPI0031D045E7
MKTTLFAVFILLSISTFSQTKVSSLWTVSNTSIVPGCPYEVCFYMELRYSSTNTPVPGSNVAVCHTISTGSSANFSYPASPAPGIVTALTGISIKIGTTTYPVSINPAPPYETIYDACDDLEPDCVTRWRKNGINLYEIHGECLTGG